jgi:hypothetical protein
MRAAQIQLHEATSARPPLLARTECSLEAGMSESRHASQQAEVDTNYAHFLTEVRALMATEAGRYALYRKGQRVAILDTMRDAVVVGEMTGGLPFSVQQITLA